MTTFELTPSERITLREVADGTYRQSSNQDALTTRLRSLEDKGFIYLSTAGYGTTDKGKEALRIYYGGRLPR